MASGKIATRIVVEGEREYTLAIKNITSAQRLLKAEMKDVTASFKNVANSEEALQKKQEVLVKQLDQAQKRYDAYAKVVDKAKVAQQEAAKQVEQMVAAHGKESAEAKRAQSEYDRITQKLTSYQTAMHNAKADVATLTDEVEKNSRYLAEAQASADKCAHSIDNLGRETRESKEDISGMEDALNAIASSVVFEKISAGAKEIARALRECVEAADLFEYGMAKVQSIARVGDAELSGMGNEIQELAVKYGASANEIAEATYQAISASVDSADAISFVEDAMTLARGGFTDTVTAVDVMTTALNAYGKEANSTEHIMDSLVTVQNLGKTTVGELAESLGLVIPTAASYNVSLDNLSAAYIQLTKNGVKMANATTFINGMLAEMADSGSNVGKILKEETGQSFGQLMETGKSLGDVIQILGETVDGDAEKFANLFGNVRAGKAAATIFKNSTDEFNRSLEAVANSAGTAKEAFAIMADTSEMTSKRMDAAVENMRVAVGEALQPTIDSFKESGVAMLEPLADFVEANPEIVGAIAGVTTAVTGVATAMTAAAAATALLKAMFHDMTGVATILGSAAVAGGILGLATASKSASAEVITLSNNVKNTASSMDGIAKDYDSQAQAIENFANQAKLLQMVESELSETQRTEMAVAVNALNEAFPDLGLVIDETTGKIKDYNNELDASIEKEVERYKWTLKQEEAQELIKKRVELEEQQIKAKDKLTEAQERLNKALASGRDVTAEAQEVDEAQRAYDRIGDTIDDVDKEYGDLIQSTKGATDATEEFAEGQEDAQEEANITKNRLEELKEAYSKAKESAMDSLESQRDAFQELGQAAREGTEEAKVSLSDMAQGYEDQLNGIKDYAENVKSAMAFMQDNSWSKAFLASLVEGGTDAADELDAVVEAMEGGEEGIQKLKDMADDFNSFAKIKEQTAEYYATLETGYGSIDKAIEKNDELKESTDEIVHAYEDGHAAFVTHAEETTEVAGQIPEDAAGAITENAQLVADSETEMFEEAETSAYASLGMDGEGGQSSVYYNMGASVSQSFADGISSGTDSVSSAMASLCEAAVNAIDVSGLAGKVSETVSKVISEAESKLASDVVSSTSRQARMEGAGGHR